MNAVGIRPEHLPRWVLFLDSIKKPNECLLCTSPALDTRDTGKKKIVLFLLDLRVLGLGECCGLQLPQEPSYFVGYI